MRVIEGLRWRWYPIRRKLRPRVYFAACQAFVHLGMKVPQRMRTEYVGLALLQAEKTYTPHLFPGAITLYRGRGLYDADPDMGWKGLAAQIEHVEISDGSKQRLRRDIMGTPLVRQLADRLALALSGNAVRKTPELSSKKAGSR